MNEDILKELKEIKETLQTIASGLERKESELEYPINYFIDDPEALAVIRNKDVSKIIQEIVHAKSELTKIKQRFNDYLK